MRTSVRDVEVGAPVEGRHADILTPDALAFVARLHREFEPSRRKLLRRRADVRERIAAGETLGFLEETRWVRDGGWAVSEPPSDLQDRRVEITGPTDRKMAINALNSGAKVFMADFEDANAPTWDNMVSGQVNLIDAIEGTISHTSAEGKEYRLGDEVATLVVRPRGWHLVERHVVVDGEPVSASLFDFGMYLFHNADRLAERGSGPYFYLPKLDKHTEARLWNDVFVAAQDALGLPHGTIRATVLIETIHAAFEMDEILYELRDHAAGLNAGRWDYIFSIIKTFRDRPGAVLPDRNQVTMTVPFMRAYTELLVKTCHSRGAHAIGGMAAYVPSRRDPAANERALAKVREDKVREADAGFDGTWVAHPDLVDTARAPFDDVLGGYPNQRERLRPEVAVEPERLLDFDVPGGRVTEQGLRNDIAVAIRYLTSWLGGNGAVAIYGLMEDAATAEIARSQVWQWVRHGARLDDGRRVDRALVRALEEQEVESIRAELTDDDAGAARVEDARALFEEVALGSELVDFLTLPAYEYLD